VDWSDESQGKRKGLDLRGADLRYEDLHGLPLAKIVFSEAQLKGTNLSSAQLEGANLIRARLEGANLMEAQLKGASLSVAQLKGANFGGARLEGADLSSAQLKGANLEDVFLAAEAHHMGPQLADMQWGDTNLAVVDWEQITMLGDERVAAQKIDMDGEKKEKDERLADYKAAVRAYRQLSVELRNQGLNEDAARFAYRAQLMQRVVFRLQRKIGQYLFSLFLDLLAGYGYKPWRSFLAYLLVIVAFATAYFVIGHTVGPVLSPLGSFVFSMTSFHGRGFFPGGISLDDPMTVLAALEAFVGLLIEVTFIATLTQRLFGK